MGKTYARKTKVPKKPKTPKLVCFLAVLALGALSLAQAGQDAYKEGDSFLSLLGGYQADTQIPGTGELESFPYNPDGFHCQCPPCTYEAMTDPEYTEHYFVGMGYSHFLAPDVSLELAGWLPIGDAGADTLSASAGLNYFFDHLFVPLELQYRGDLDSLGFGTGIGLDYPLKDGKTVVRGQAGPEYLGNADIDDQWTWSLDVSVGWKLGKK